ncbi:hypothetical protein CHUAL_008001 [Chamberlinius hualienensis]
MVKLSELISLWFIGVGVAYKIMITLSEYNFRVNAVACTDPRYKDAWNPSANMIDGRQYTYYEYSYRVWSIFIGLGFMLLLPYLLRKCLPNSLITDVLDDYAECIRQLNLQKNILLIYILSAIIAVTEIISMNFIVDGTLYDYGFELFKLSLESDHRNDGLAKIFPKIIRTIDNDISITCAVPLNEIMEKTYIMSWFLLFVELIKSICNIVYYLLMYVKLSLERSSLVYSLIIDEVLSFHVELAF